MIQEIFKNLLRQPDQLPVLLKEQILRELPAEKMLLYAFCDLDERRRFAETWVVLTEGTLVVARKEASDSNNSAWRLQKESLDTLEALEMSEGLTMGVMRITDKQKKVLVVLVYTRRQGRSVSSLRFAVEQLLKQKKDATTPRALAGNIDPTREYQETVIKAVTEAKATLVTHKLGVMRRLFGYMKPHRKVVIAGMTMATVLTLMRLIPPYLTRVLVDDILRPAERGAIQNPMFWIWVVIGAMAAIWAIVEFLSFLRMRTMAIMGEKVAMTLRDDVYSHMQTLSLSFFGSKPTGSLITRVSSDTDRLWDFITFGFVDIAMAVIQILGVAVALFLQDWILALPVVITVPIVISLIFWHSGRMQVMFMRIWSKWSAMTAVLSDVIPGMRVVKAFAQEEQEVKRFGEKNLAVEQEAENLHREWTRFCPMIVVLMHLCTVNVWLKVAPIVLKHMQTGGAEGLPLGIFLAFLGYLWMFWDPVHQLGMMSRTINRVTTSASRVFEVLDTVPTILDKPDAKKIGVLEGAIVFDNVTFTYDGIRNVLKGISFEVKPGEMIGLVGPSGGGKTTLVNLICRFYDVKDGRVMVDGHDVRDLELSMLRRQIGVVLQEPYLFHGTIAENIAYGSDTANLDDIIRAARAANAHEFICGFLDGYETIVGERGQTLSGGERQRISIARAILHNPRILILDEATSSVDTETEKKIQEALRRLVAGRTTFAIAHRLSTLSSADRLFVLEDGKLVEQGAHAELVAKEGGLYAKLHKTQQELHATIAI